MAEEFRCPRGPISPIPQPFTHMAAATARHSASYSSSCSSASADNANSLSVACSLKRKRPPMIQISRVLQEIPAEKIRFRDCPQQEDAACVSELGVALSSVKGKKKFMEDTHRIFSCSSGNSKKVIFGVYDGHGGKNAAEFVAQKLHSNILGMLENSAGNVGKEEAIKAGYLKTDEEFLKQGLGSGACCVTALIEGGEQIVVSNLGDCRAVISRSGVAEALTKDHRAEGQEERKRIENKGGYVEIHRGAWRVHGVLSVSRSIGDAHLKSWMMAEPETRILNMTLDMEFLVLASDGLWEKVGNQEAVDIVKKLVFSEKKLVPAGDLQEEGNENRTCVNTSPPPKQLKISVAKKQTRSHSPCYTKVTHSWKEREDGLARENESPPSKARKISLVKRKNLKTQSANQENDAYKTCDGSARLANACKELVNLAVARGSLDDITVMIIDLNHFRCK